MIRDVMHTEQMKFTSQTVTYDVVDGSHVAGLASMEGTDGYLMLQRSWVRVKGKVGVVQHDSFGLPVNFGYCAVKLDFQDEKRYFGSRDAQKPIFDILGYQAILPNAIC